MTFNTKLTSYNVVIIFGILLAHGTFKIFYSILDLKPFFFFFFSGGKHGVAYPVFVLEQFYAFSDCI